MRCIWLRHFIALSLLLPCLYTEMKAQGALHLAAPVAGERVSQGDVIKVAWRQFEVSGPVDIQIWLADHGKWYEVLSGVDVHLEEISWQVPRSMSGKCRLKIVSTVNRAVQAYGKSFFFIEKSDAPGAVLTFPSDQSAIQLAPNPASTSVDVAWPIDRVTTRLNVVDLLGNLVYEFLPAGLHSTTINVSDWPSGTYKVQLHAGSGSTWHSTLIVQR